MKLSANGIVSESNLCVPYHRMFSRTCSCATGILPVKRQLFCTTILERCLQRSADRPDGLVRPKARETDFLFSWSMGVVLPLLPCWNPALTVLCSVLVPTLCSSGIALQPRLWSSRLPVL